MPEETHHFRVGRKNFKQINKFEAEEPALCRDFEPLTRIGKPMA